VAVGEAVSEAVARALARTELFGSLEPAALERLAGECHVRRYAKGERVFAKGDLGSAMFLVAQGSVSLSVGSADGGEVVLAVLNRPQTFGELAVIDGGPRVATATARTATVLVTIPGAQVQRLLRDHPLVGQSLLSALADLIRRIDEHSSDLVLLELPDRVAKFLISAARRANPAAVDGTAVPVDLNVTQTELAQLVGGSRQQVNRVIATLEKEGAIKRQGPRIVAVRVDLLSRR